MVDALISVVVPVYNSEKYLEKCIKSIVNQTYSKIEILLINDGSTDNSLNICNAFAKIDSRIRVVSVDNGGQARARNIGIGLSEGQYIGFVDSDDWIMPEMYEILLAGILESGSEISMCGRNNEDTDGNNLNQLFTYSTPITLTREDAIRRFLLSDGIDSSSWDKLYSRKLIINNLYPEGYICEDMPFVFSAIINANSIYHVGRPLYNYVQREGSTSHSSYLKKTDGMVIYPREIQKMVYSKCIKYKQEADYFLARNIMGFIRRCYQADKYKSLPVEWKLSDDINVIVNKYISCKDKFLFVLYRSHLLFFYILLRKVKRKLIHRGIQEQ